MPKFIIGAAGRCTKTSAAGILNFESHISHLQQQCNFVSSTEAGCHFSSPQKVCLMPTADLFCGMQLPFAMQQTTDVQKCRWIAEFGSYCYWCVCVRVGGHDVGCHVDKIQQKD